MSVKHSRSHFRRPKKATTDHADAWLMSYADMITLLFMLFVIFVSVSMTRHGIVPFSKDEPEHPYHTSDHSGYLNLVTRYDAVFHAIAGIISENRLDENMAVEKTDHSIRIDMSALEFFEPGSAEIPESELPALKAIAQAIKEHAPGDYAIEVEGYTDNEPLEGSRYANNWELSAMRAAHVVSLLEEEGVDPERLHTAGYAGNHPLVPNNDEAGNPIFENRAKNQRLVIKIETAPDSGKRFSSL